jgi:WD40 repeat protein
MFVLTDKGYRARVEFVAFAPTGELYACSYDGTFRWPDPTAQARELVSSFRYALQVWFSPCGRYFATCQDKLSLFDREHNTRTVLRVPENVWHTAGTFADDLMLVLQHTAHGSKPRVIARRLEPDKWNEDLWVSEPDHLVRALVGCVAGKRLMYVMSWWAPSTLRTAYRYVQLDARTGAVVDQRDGPEPGSALAVSDDGETVATVLNNRLTVIAAENCAEPLAELKNEGKKHFTGIAFHPSGKYLAATSNDETVKLYDTNTWEVAHTFTWKIGRMRCIAFSPDGALAAAGSDKGQVVVWDVDL